MRLNKVQDYDDKKIVNDYYQISSDNSTNLKDKDPLLCKHCGRTKRNNITCKGMCVEDNEY
tara:strand:- start:697 stop:879 length:183 start_codon:yes stop_codon:yes gene_type:complete